MAAILVAKYLGMSFDEISRAASKINPSDGSIKLIKRRNDPYVLDASYSSNPDGVIGDLNYLKVWQGKKIIVMPCLIELGKMSKKAHIRIGNKIGEVCDLAVITTGDYFEEIKSGAVSSGMDEKDILFIDDPEEIIRKVNIFSEPGDVLLLEGRNLKEVINFFVR